MQTGYFAYQERCSNGNVPKFPFGFNGQPDAVGRQETFIKSFGARARLSSAGISWIVQIPAFMASTPRR
jgi:hypothetical protein